MGRLPLTQALAQAAGHLGRTYRWCDTIVSPLSFAGHGAEINNFHPPPKTRIFSGLKSQCTNPRVRIRFNAFRICSKIPFTNTALVTSVYVTYRRFNSPLYM